MKSTWLHKKGKKKLILFFSGWGVDTTPFSMIDCHEYDLLFFDDYAKPDISLTLEELNEYKTYYDQIVVVGWSMGVWMANKVLSSYDKYFKSIIAINGTLCPINPELGIDPMWFRETLNTLDNEVMLKFYHRMCRSEKIYTLFSENRPKRSLSNLKDELRYFYHNADDLPVTTGGDFYTDALISSKDFVFPKKKQTQYWESKTARIYNHIGFHHIFYDFDSWDDIIETITHC